MFADFSFYNNEGAATAKMFFHRCQKGQLAVAPRDFLRCRVASQKKPSFFCAAGLHVKKNRVFSAPEGHSSKKTEFFLRRRVARQKKLSFFCAAGSFVKKN